MDEDQLAEALHRILDWANAYPEDIFPPQDLKKADEVLKQAGISMSAMYGTWGRWITNGIREIAKGSIKEGK